MSQEDQDFVLLEDKDLADFNVEGLLPQPAEEIEKIQKWLQPTDYASESSEFNKHRLSYTTGTGKWIQEAEQYQHWLNSPDCGFLWIKGVAGSGKSVVAAHVATLIEEPKVPVLHFFFRQIIASNKTPQSLIRDWLSQLLNFSPALQLKLKAFPRNGRSLDSVSFDDLWELLTSALSEIPRAYCIADALDEMDLGNESFMKILTSLGQRNPSQVKVLVTSRPLPYIEKVLSQTSVTQLVLRQQLVDRDILTYLSTRLSSISLPDESKVEIERVIGRRSQGLFLYARLMLDEIVGSENSDFQSINDALQRLPTGLGEMYTRMLSEHSARSGTPQELQLLILQCVTHSSRPLRLLELSTVADFVRKMSKFKIFSPPMGLSKDTKSIIRQGCGPLLEILEDETVSIIHHSFTEFLVNSDRNILNSGEDGFPHIDLSETHLELAKLCVNYLLMDWLPNWSESEDSKNTAQLARLNHPFFDYAINNWYYHVSRYSQADNDLFQDLDRLLEPGSRALSLCLSFMGVETRSLSPLHISALKGLTAYAFHLIDLGHDINAIDSDSRTPLHRAAEKGHHEVVKVLLEQGAANNMDDYAGLTPLHLAASADHGAVVKLLLVAGVDPFTPKTREHPGRRCGNARRTEGDTAVEYACEYGHTQAAVEFIPFLDPDGLSKVLCWAACGGRTEIVHAVLEASQVDVNKMQEGKTPIQYCAHSHDITSMKKLLELGADVSIKSDDVYGHGGMRCFGPADRNNYTPLHAFAQSCRGTLKNSLLDTLEGIKLLLAAGCDINTYSEAGLTPLQHAIRNTGSHFDHAYCLTEVVEFLLSNGADISLCAKDGSTVLHLASGEPESTIDLLIAHGADLNSRRPSDGRTPLLCAVSGYSESTMLALIKHGADCNTQDSEGITPLQIVLQDFSPSMSKVKALLDNGADPNFRNKKGETPLHVMRSWVRQGNLLSLLIGANADLEAKTHDGLTVLLRAVKNNTDLADIKSLIKAGARLDARDFDGRTVLHYCCEKEKCIQVLGALVDLGADPSLKDFSGNTLFHQVARQPPSYHEKEQLELLMTLLELGVSPSLPNNAGQTPFHIAAGMDRARHSWSRYKTDPYQFLLGPQCNLDINAADNKSIRPIHLAATLSENQVKDLLDRGADPLLLTIEGQSVLHIAARCRQSNIVGMMVELYRNLEKSRMTELGRSQFDELGQSSMVDLADQHGRTALHYAVRSGRIESVAILLEIGRANPNVKDSKGRTPLDMCTEFHEEDTRWQFRSTSVDRPAYIAAAYVTLDDPYRPWSCENGNWASRLDFKSDITSENHTVGIRQIIRLLIRYGADVAFMFSKTVRTSYQGRNTTYEAAVATDCEVMVDELLHIQRAHAYKTQLVAKKPSDLNSSDESDDDNDASKWPFSTPWNNFSEKYVALRIQTSPNLLEGIVAPGESNLAVFHTLLRTENERGIEEFKRLGADLLKPQWDGQSCMALLVKWGYASVVEKFATEAALMTQSWMEETEKTDCNLPGRLRHLLHIACERALPNLDVIKALPLEDIDFQSIKNIRTANTFGRTALHILAPTTHWWQSHALEYLLEQGANPNLRDERGCTALHLAVDGTRKELAVEILLRHGADPNILNEDGLTCLNKAGSDTSIIQRLIKAGADVSAGKKPFVFDAIAALDLATVNLLVEMGADFNVRPTPEQPPVLDGADRDGMKWLRLQQHVLTSKSVAEMSYPIHYAASKYFNRPLTKEKIMLIIKELLKGGANPLLTFNEEGDSILHDICENEGILEPFLDLQDLDYEARDSKGKTYLLAACSTADDYFRSTNFPWLKSQPSSAQLLLAKGADITAIDNEGRTVFHHLLRTSSRYIGLRASHPTDFGVFLEHPLAATLVIQKDNKGAKPLHHALRGKQLWAIERLVEKDADPLEADPEGNTALHHLAAQFCPSYVVAQNNTSSLAVSLFDKFLSLGTDINTPNALGETPVFALIPTNGFCMENLQLFESRGADLTVIDKSGRGLLHVIAKNRAEVKTEEGVESPTVSLFRYLMSKGLDPMMEDVDQRTSLDVVMASGSVGILEIFKRDK